MANFNNSGRKKKILIVEDMPPIARYVADIVEKYGTVEIAHNGQEGLTKVALEDFDIIISDIMMPVMNGIEFYKAAIEADSSLKSRFLFHTSSFSLDHLNFFIDNNVPYLMKLPDKEEMESAVSEILGRAHCCSSEDAEGGA
jgi:CheY-like chemotaxis protein